VNEKEMSNDVRRAEDLMDELYLKGIKSEEEHTKLGSIIGATS